MRIQNESGTGGAEWTIALRRSLSLAVGRRAVNLAALRAWRHHPAFTLIELLVVITITATLAAMLLLALHRTKLRPRMPLA